MAKKDFKTFIQQNPPKAPEEQSKRNTCVVVISGSNIGKIYYWDYPDSSNVYENTFISKYIKAQKSKRQIEAWCY